MMSVMSFYIWLVRIGIFGNIIGLSAWLYLALWFDTELWSLKFGNPGIDYWTHIASSCSGRLPD
jgi:membrane associated rhomboid family serine protease